MAITPIYTWTATLGDLHLYREDGDYTLRYETKKDHKTTELLKGDVEGIEFSSLPSDVDRYCQNYFFRVDRKNGHLRVKFFEADVIDNFVPNEASKKKLKAMGDIGFEFNTLEKKVTRNFSDKAPVYRTVARGLNLEGICATEGCPAFEQYVVIPLGTGTFRPAEEADKSKCPSCDELIPFNSITNLGFWNCSFKIEGKQTEPDEKQVERDGNAEKSHYTTYRGDDLCKWSYLIITTEKPESKGGCTLL